MLQHTRNLIRVVGGLWLRHGMSQQGKHAQKLLAGLCIGGVAIALIVLTGRYTEATHSPQGLVIYPRLGSSMSSTRTRRPSFSAAGYISAQWGSYRSR